MMKNQQQKNQNNKLLSIDFDDNNENYDEFKEFIDETTERKKNKIVKDIEEMGDIFFHEIDRKLKNNRMKSKKLIPYILKKTENYYSEDELVSYSYEDVKKIYDQIKYDNRPVILKVIQILIGK